MDTAIHDMIFRVLAWAKYFGLAFAFIAVFTAGCICLWDIARMALDAISGPKTGGHGNDLKAIW